MSFQEHPLSFDLQTLNFATPSRDGTGYVYVATNSKSHFLPQANNYLQATIFTRQGPVCINIRRVPVLNKGCLVQIHNSHTCILPLPENFTPSWVSVINMESSPAILLPFREDSPRIKPVQVIASKVYTHDEKAESESWLNQYYHVILVDKPRKKPAPSTKCTPTPIRAA